MGELWHRLLARNKVVPKDTHAILRTPGVLVDEREISNRIEHAV